MSKGLRVCVGPRAEGGEKVNAPTCESPLPLSTAITRRTTNHERETWKCSVGNPRARHEEGCRYFVRKKCSPETDPQGYLNGCCCCFVFSFRQCKQKTKKNPYHFSPETQAFTQSNAELRLREPEAKPTRWKQKVFTAAPTRTSQLQRLKKKQERKN